MYLSSLHSSLVSFILGTQAIHNIRYDIYIYFINSLGTEDEFPYTISILYRVLETK